MNGTLNLITPDLQEIFEYNREIPINDSSNQPKRFYLFQYTLFAVLSALSNSLFYFFSQPLPIWYLILSIIPPSIFIYETVPLIIILFIFCLFHIYLDLSKEIPVIFSKIKDKSALFSVWSENKFTPKRKFDLNPGEILLIKENEAVPSDVLLIASESSDRVSSFDVFNATGENEPQKKIIVKEIQSLIDSDVLEDAKYYLNSIEGVLLLDEPSFDFSQISGKIKLSKAPSSLKINGHSVVLSGSVLRYPSWVFAVILYSNSDTKLGQASLKSKRIKSKNEKLIEKFQTITIILVIVLALVNYLIKHSAFDSFISHLVLYSFFLPMPLIAVFPLATWVYSFYLRLGDKSFRVSDPSTLHSLGQIDYALVNKSSLIQNPEPKTRTLLINNNLYIIDKAAKPESSENTNLLVAEPDTALDSLKKNIENNKTDCFNFIRALALCNQVYTKGPASNLISSAEDKALISIAEEIGIKLLKKNNKKITIKHNGAESEYKVLAFRSSTQKNKKIRVLLENLQKTEFFFYVRGPWEAMSKLADSQITRHVERLWISSPGVRVLAYGAVSLTQKQVEKFLNSYNMARKTAINKQGRIQALFDNFDDKLMLIGCAGLEERLESCDIAAVGDLKNAGIKVWISGADSEERVYSTGLSSGIVEKESQIVRIPEINTAEEMAFILQGIIKNHVFLDNFRISSNLSNESEEEKAEIKEDKKDSLYFKQRESRMSLDELRRSSLHPLVTVVSDLDVGGFSLNKPFSSDLSCFVLMVSGKTVDMAMRSSECLKLFSLAMFAAKSVCFFEMLPHHFSYIERIMKDCFAFSPSCFGFGDHFVGVRVSQEADFEKGAEIVSRNLSQIKDAVLVVGMDLYLKVSRIAKLAVYVNFYLGGLVFFHCYFSDFSSSWVVSVQNLYFFVFFVESLVYFVSIFGGQMSEKVANGTYRQIYLTGVLGQELDMSTLVVSAVYGLISAVFTYFLMILSFIDGVDSSGKSFDSTEIDVFLLIIIAISCQVCALIDSLKISLLILLSHLAISAFFFAYLLITNFSQSNSNFSSLSAIFNSPSLVLSTILIILLNASFFYCKTRWSTLFKPTLYDYYRAATTNFSVIELKSRQTLHEWNLESAYKDNSLADSVPSKSLSLLNPYLLIFQSASKELEYTKQQILSYRSIYLINFSLFLVSSVGVFLYTGISVNTLYWQRVLLFLTAILSLAATSLIFTRIYNNYTVISFKTIYFLGIYFAVISIILQYNSFSIFFSTFPLIFMLGSNIWLRFLFPIALALSTLDIYCKSHTFSADQNSSYYLAEYTLFLLGIVFISFIASYFLDYYKRQEFLLVSQVINKTTKANEVLKLLLPSFVINNVKSGIYYISIDEGIVSVLFCNICNFEEMTSDLSPTELTSFLDELYNKFDQLCDLLGVSKIETVGKTYMASAGIKDSENELDGYLAKISHARRLVELAFAMLRVIQKTFIKGQKVHVKIGINSGPVRAGVVGYHKPQFSLVGDTVNIASRMATTLTEYDSIQITLDCYEIIKDSHDLAFYEHCSFVKGKGEMHTFLVRQAYFNDLISNEHEMGEGLGAQLKEPQLSCRISNSFISLSAANPEEFLMKAGQSKKSHAGGGPKQEPEAKNKISMLVKKSSPFRCSFKMSRKEEKFRLRYLGQKLRIFYISICVTLVVYLGNLVSEAIYLVNHSKTASVNLITSVLVLALCLIILPLIRIFYRSHYFSLGFTVILFFPLLLHIFSDIFDTKSSTTITSLKFCFHILLLTQSSPLLLSYQFLTLVLALLIWLSFFIYAPSAFTFTPFFFLFLSYFSSYSTETKLRIYSKLQSSNQKELKNLENLLTQMVPPHAYEHLKQDNTVIDKLSQVTLLYADIVGFTAWSSNKYPEEVVQMLNEMFTRFDKMCVVHSVYKVHTIGDCYVAMSNTGGGDGGRDVGQECVNVMKFGKALIDCIQEVNSKYNMGINMRIGVHTGDVIAGITGKCIVRYDIYGNDVFIANNMESNGCAGKIAVSKTTMNLIRNFRPSLMSFEKNKNVEVFGEEIEVFFAKFN